MEEQLLASNVLEWRSVFVDYLTVQASNDSAHDIYHHHRVWQHCLTIAQTLAGSYSKIDPLILVAAAYLHDLVNVPKNSPNRSIASRLSAEKARDVLLLQGFPKHKIGAIEHAIKSHSFSANIPPITIEAKIVQDADRLDALGAIGLARVLCISGQLNRRMFHPGDPLAKNRALDEGTYAVDHVLKKIIRLPEEMNTECGRTLADKQTKIIRDFLSELELEVGIRNG
ncbi:MAG: HD domain-containing protein [Proteobacteria bacterium]|nr:HD domain-containing protein [Pseudomonadota bacterium]